jgi:hypothetical protein
MNPCETCDKKKECGRNRTACHAFALYVHDGRFRPESVVPREPTRSVYSRLMWFDDDTLIRQIQFELRKGIHNDTQARV